MEFEEAIECTDALELKECLKKTLNFLTKNNSECCFPNISPHIEALMVGLATDTRNLKCKLFNAECKKLALEIVEVLEMNRDVFRWIYGYENGTVNKNLLVYKKIFSNKMKMKPMESKKSVSLISQRLILSQSQDPAETQFDIPTGCKIQLLNKTLRFLKSDGEGLLQYPDMPIAHAQYMCMLVNSPKSDLSVGFGFKSLYAPLFEALDEYGLEYEFTISFTEGNGDTASLKLEKIKRNKEIVKKKVAQQKEDKNSRENSFENSSKSETTLETNSKELNNPLNVSLNSSTSSNRSRNGRRRRNRLKLTDGVPAGFVADTLQSLIAFTTDVSRASITFDGLTDKEAAFVKGVKTLAGSTSNHDSLEAPLRTSLQQLNSNIATVMETCKFRVEEGLTKSKARFITLKKVPKDNALRKLPSAIKLPTKSRALSAASSKDSSTSKDSLIQFKSAGKLDPNTGEATDKPEPAAASAQGGAKTKDYLNKRKAKLLEDLSVPVESDKGKRMMERMGWAGGALGARAGGILEPILPAIELPAGAGLGHVPPPKPETRRPADFRLALLHNVRDLLLHPAPSKLLEYKLPLTKKEKAYVTAAVTRLNNRTTPPAGVKEEQGLVKLLLGEMALLGRDVELRAEVSQDLRKVTLTKFKNPAKLQLSKPKANDPVPTIPNSDCELVDDEAIQQVLATIHTSCRTPVAIKGRAMRVLFLRRFVDVVRGSGAVKGFRVVGSMQVKMMAFLENVVKSVNQRVRCSYVADEEQCLYDELKSAASNRDCTLDIVFESPSKFVLRKISDRTELQHNQARLAEPTCPKPAQDNNNNDQQNKPDVNNKIIPQNVAKNTIGNNNDKFDVTRNLNKPITKDIAAEVANHKEVAKLETKCHSDAIILVRNESLKESLKDKEVKIQTKSDRTIAAGVDNHKEVAKLETNCDNEANILVRNESLKYSLNVKEVKLPTKTDRTIAAAVDNYKEVPKPETKCDSDAIILVRNESLKESLKVKEVKIQTKSSRNHVSGLVEEGNVKIEKDAKIQHDCDIKRKDNVINSITKDKNIVKQEIKTEDDDTDDSWSTWSENEVDLSHFDKEFEELDKVLSEVGLGCNVKDSDTSISSPSDSSVDFFKLNAKKTKAKCKKNVVVISPRSQDTKMHRKIFETVQTLIWNQIDREDYAIPLLKCHGVQNGGLVYSCHDEKDVAWLKKTINVAKLDLKMFVFADDFIEEKNTRKMAIKINSFMPLDAEKVFSKIEMYNDIYTKPWKVLSYESFSSYVIFIVEVDMMSFDYISEENFSLYMGIDEAQFSIIF